MNLLRVLPQSQAFLGLVILLATFVYEDGATLLAATLSASGRLNPWFGLATTFTGIWLGDLGLYLLGSTVGRRPAWSKLIRKYLTPESLARAEKWFAQHGSFALVMSRAIPGSRLPLYTAAGALRLSVRVFAKTTAVCSAVWVGVIFATCHFVPNLPSSHGARFSLLITSAVLFAPWAIAKFSSVFGRAEERAASAAVRETASVL